MNDCQHGHTATLSAPTHPQTEPVAGPDVSDWGRRFEDLASRLDRRFRRREQRARVREYLQALLSPLDRKNGWQIAEAAGVVSLDQMQRFVRTAPWDEHAVQDNLPQYVIEHLADLSDVLVLDETGFLTRGERSAGVQRQYSGTAGRIKNCQIGVFLAYASAKGSALIDGELYLPKSWTDDRERCRQAGISDDVAFATKPELARQMLERARSARVTANWVTADEVYGGNPVLRNWLRSHGQSYVMAVAQTEAVQVAGLRDPKPVPAWDLIGCLYGVLESFECRCW